MMQFIQDLLVIVFGFALVLALLFALRSVHRQQKRLKELEAELSAKNQSSQLTQETEEQNGEKSIL